jgi:hypothetical protein
MDSKTAMAGSPAAFSDREKAARRLAYGWFCALRR